MFLKLSNSLALIVGCVLALQEKAPLIGFAMASGVCIFFGNLAEQYALALAGVTIAVPMFSSCIVVLGAPYLRQDAHFVTPFNGLSGFTIPGRKAVTVS